MQELYKKYRPKTLKAVIGQEAAVKILRGFFKEEKIPHSLLFTGPSGCGKTTLARIVASKLGCGDGDLFEINCADFRGIDMVRDIRSMMNRKALSANKCRVWIIDEAHKLSNDAQNAFLKPLEDTPRHVYFMLATSEPDRLIAAIKTRCTQIPCGTIQARDLESLFQETAKQEKASLSEDVLSRLVECSDGSARMGMVLLHQLLQFQQDAERLEFLRKQDTHHQAIEIARALLNKKPWKDVATILKSVTEDAESLRWMILGYARNVLLGGGKLAPRAYLLIVAFGDNFYDSKLAGLAAACYDVSSQ